MTTPAGEDLMRSLEWGEENSMRTATIKQKEPDAVVTMPWLFLFSHAEPCGSPSDAPSLVASAWKGCAGHLHELYRVPLLAGVANLKRASRT